MQSVKIYIVNATVLLSSLGGWFAAVLEMVSGVAQLLLPVASLIAVALLARYNWLKGNNERNRTRKPTK